MTNLQRCWAPYLAGMILGLAHPVSPAWAQSPSDPQETSNPTDRPEPVPEDAPPSPEADERPDGMISPEDILAPSDPGPAGPPGPVASPSPDEGSEPVSDPEVESGPSEILIPDQPPPAVLPVQRPVPAPPGESHRGEGRGRVTDRQVRLFDLGARVAARLARDLGGIYRPSFGGITAQVTPVGSPWLGNAELAPRLNGLPLGIPLTSRGAQYADLDTLPILAIESIQWSPPKGVRIETRALHGVEGGLWWGESGAGRAGLVGGWVDEDRFVSLAVEAERIPLQSRHTSADRMVALMTGGGRHAGVDWQVTLRGYGRRWDEAPRRVWGSSDELEVEPGAGGVHRGAGLGGRIRWIPTPKLEAEATAGWIDDRWDAHGGMARQREGHRVATGDLAFLWTPDVMIPIQLGASASLTYQRSQTALWGDGFLGAEGPSSRTDRDWFVWEPGLEMTATPWSWLQLRAEVGFEQRSFRVGGRGAGARPWSAQESSPRGGISLELRELGSAAVSLGYNRRNLPSPALAGGDGGRVDPGVPLAQAVERVSLRGEMAFDLGGFDLHADAEAYIAAYGALLDAGIDDGIEGGIGGPGLNLAAELTHRASGVSVVAQAGATRSASWRGVGTVWAVAPALSNGLGAGAPAVGVTPYHLRLGLLRSSPRGFVAELWFEAVAPTPVSALDAGLSSSPYGGFDARLGYRSDPLTFWVGVENAFDQRAPIPGGGWEQARTPRRGFVMIEVTDS